MPVSTDGRGLKAARTQINESLETARKAVRLEQTDWAGYLRLTEKQYQTIISGRQDLPLMSLYALAENLKLDLGDLALGKIDYDALTAHFLGNDGYLSEKYSVAAFSKVRTLNSYMNYIESMRGPGFKKIVCHKFQLTEKVLSDPGRDVNLNLFADLLRYLRIRGFTPADFERVGSRLATDSKDSAIGTTLRKLSTSSQIYEAFFEDLVVHQEQNCSYEIEALDEKSCLIVCRSNPDIAHALSVKTVGSQDICRYKVGALASLTRFIGKRPSQVTELQCAHLGAATCQFLIDYSPAPRLTAIAGNA